MANVIFFRGEYPESVHHVLAVAVDRQRKILWQTGDAHEPVFWRSGAKPFQILPLLAAGGADRFSLTESEVAIIASSHSGARFHTEAVKTILGKMGLNSDALDCGIARPLDDVISREIFRSGEPYTNLHNDCSGKHSGMLGLSLIKGYPLTGYRKADHPVQQEMRQAVAKAAGMDANDLTEGIDGCGVPTFRIPLLAMAFAYAQLAWPAPEFWDAWTKPIQQVRDAMRQYPEYVGGEGRYETNLMRVTQGRLVAKLGAEASFCIGHCEQGLGFACKVQDGGMRVLPSFCTQTLVEIGWISSAEAAKLNEMHPHLIRNEHGDVVGRVTVSNI